jgi:alpha-1,6-mannosyltransferase
MRYRALPGLLLLALGLLLYRWFAVREDFGPLMAYVAVCGAGCFWMLANVGQNTRPIVVLAAGMGLRALLLGDQPHLSEDVYRFLWDGHLWNHGVHPFAHTPRYVLEQLQVPGITAEWLARLNSPDYHTVYPPLGQLFFRIAAYVADGNLTTGVFLLQFFIFLGECLTLVALWRWLEAVRPEWTTMGLALYAFHPLAIIETVGNIHFEGMMVGCMLAALVCLHRGRDAWAGTWWAAGIAVKLLPLLFAPLLAGWLGGPRVWRFGLATAIATVAFFMPLADVEVLRNMQRSVGLYFQKFEFNASLYYLLSHASPWFTGWYEGAIIGPTLGQITVFVLLYWSYWLFSKKTTATLGQLQTALLGIGTLYLFNATTVHPWYIVVPLALGAGTGLVYPALWGVLAFLSYSHYIGGGRQEQFGWIALEYGAVLLAIVAQWRFAQNEKGSPNGPP